MKKIIRLLPVLILLIIISCDNKKQKEQPLQNDNKEIILYCNGCEEDTEIISDLENSVDANKDFLTAHHIKLRIDTVENKCGCKLIWNKKGKTIESVMTDIELQNELKEFFEIK